MKASVLCFLGYAAALTGIASHYDLAKGGSCGLVAGEGQLRAAVPAALYQDGKACGTCLKRTTAANHSTVAHITDQCADCGDTQILLSSSTTGDWVPAACPPAAGISWHKDSQKFWALFQIVNYPEQIRAVRAYSTYWATLIPTPWGEYMAPSINRFVMEYFRVEIQGASGATNQYFAVFPYASVSPPQSDYTNYPGPIFRLLPA